MSLMYELLKRQFQGVSFWTRNRHATSSRTTPASPEPPHILTPATATHQRHPVIDLTAEDEDEQQPQQQKPKPKPYPAERGSQPLPTLRNTPWYTSQSQPATDRHVPLATPFPFPTPVPVPVPVPVFGQQKRKLSVGSSGIDFKRRHKLRKMSSKEQYEALRRNNLTGFRRVEVEVEPKRAIPMNDYSAQVALLYRHRRPYSAPRRNGLVSPTYGLSRASSTASSLYSLPSRTDFIDREELRRRAISGVELLRSRSRSSEKMPLRTSSPALESMSHARKSVPVYDMRQPEHEHGSGKKPVELIDLTGDSADESLLSHMRLQVNGSSSSSSSSSSFHMQKPYSEGTHVPLRFSSEAWSRRGAERVVRQDGTKRMYGLTAREIAVVEDMWDSLKDPNSVVCRRFGVEFTRKDMLTLRDGEWLNDEVINYYTTALLVHLRNAQGASLNVHIWSTHFYAKLVEDGVYRYENVRRWTKRLSGSILQFKKIIFPIHIDIHWALAVADMDKQQLVYYDTLGHDNEPCLVNLLYWIKDEVMEKTGIVLDVSQWTFSFPKDIPQQDNSCDCGIFLCQFVKHCSLDLPFNFTQADMPAYRRRLLLDIVNGGGS